MGQSDMRIKCRLENFLGNGYVEDRGLEGWVILRCIVQWKGFVVTAMNQQSLSISGNFSLHNRVQNGSGAHPTSYPMGNRVSFPGSKAAVA
jgi:hypothetical protein